MQDGELYESRFHYKENRSNAVFLFVIALILCAFMSFTYWWRTHFGGVQVDGASMNMTLYDGEMLLMDYYREGDRLDRGDVIVVDVREYPECGDTDFLIKRLIAVEGDKLYCENGQIYICYAGEQSYAPLQEDYAYYMNGDKHSYDFAEYTVGEGEVFFLGDNRNNSLDSRYQEGKSHLDRLYKQSDIYGVVPDWAIRYQTILEKIFFAR